MREAAYDAALGRANDRVRDWLQRRLDDDALEIAQLYRGQRDKLVQKLRGLYDVYLADEPTYIKARTTGAIRQLNATIDDTVSDLTDRIGRRAVDRLQDTLGLQGQQLRRLTGKTIGIEFVDLPVAAQAVLGELTTSVVGGGTFFDHLFNVSDSFKHKLVADVRGGLLGGESFEDVRTRLLRSFGVDKLTDPSGSAYGSVKVYKNEARRQWNLLMGQQAEQTGSLSVWWAILDERLTPGCAARHGYAINELDGELPPRHFNCRCVPAVFPAGTDLRPFQAEGMAWLRAHGYTRRRAMLTEADVGWGWGHEILQPLRYVKRDEDPEGTTYIALPWRELPQLARLQTDGWGSFERAIAHDRPDTVLLRRRQATTEVKMWRGWRAVNVKTHPIEVASGWVDDSAVVQPPWTPPMQRLPWEIIERWPALRGFTFPVLPSYAMALLSRVDAERYSIGAIDPGEFPGALLTGTDFAALSMTLFWRQGHPPDPYLLLGIGPVLSDPQVLISITTGTILYSTEAFDTAITPAYTRVAVAVLASDGRIWAVRPRGHAFWVLPGGHIDPGERPRDAAVREMAEETGLPTRLIRRLGVLYRPWSATIIFLALAAGAPDIPLTPDETDAAGLIDFRDLAVDERLFLMRHGVQARWQEAQQAEFDPTKHPRGAGGKFGKKPDSWDIGDDDVAAVGGRISKSLRRSISTQWRGLEKSMSGITDDPAVRDAIRFHTSDDASKTLKMLRRGVMPRAAAGYVKVMDRATRAGRLPSGTVLWRGMVNLPTARAAALVGKTVRDPSFASTSVSPAEASGYAGWWSKSSAVFRIDASRKHGLVLPEKSVQRGARGSLQVVLPRKSRFRVTAVKRVMGQGEHRGKFVTVIQAKLL